MMIKSELFSAVNESHIDTPNKFGSHLKHQYIALSSHMLLSGAVSTIGAKYN